MYAGNIRGASGIDNWLLGLAGFAGDAAQIPRVVKLALVKDADALRTQLLRWSEIDSLMRIVVSRGEPIEQNPRAGSLVVNREQLSIAIAVAFD